MSGAFAKAAALTVGLAQDPDATARPGERWSYAPWTDEFTLAPGAEPFSDLHRALCGHELAHRRISRYHWFEPWPALPMRAYAELMNGVEDPRVNAWVARSWPGSAAWMEALRCRDRHLRGPATGSLLRQFVFACAAGDAFGWRPPPWRLDPMVVAALERTCGARRRYAEVELPTPARAAEIERRGLRAAMAADVAPLFCRELAEPADVNRLEAVTLISAARGWELLRRSVFPEAQRLVETDLRRLGGRMRDEAFTERIAKAVRVGDGLSGLVEQALREAAPGPGQSGEVARAAYDAFLAAQEPGAGSASSPVAGRPRRKPLPESGLAIPSFLRAPPRRDGLDSRIDALLREQLAPLRRRLEQAFRNAPRLRLRSGYPDGVGPDLGTVRRFEIDGRGHDRLWRRMVVAADDRSAAVLIQVDNSGSMAGEEIEAAVLGTTLLAQGLHGLAPRVRFAVYGFQDALYPLKRFDEPASETVLRRLEEMSLEVAGGRPGGNNKPQHNYDGACVLAAARILAAQPCRRKVLIVISDGEPSQGGTGAAALHAAIAAARDCAIHVIGLGLGRMTQHVASYYRPHHVAGIEPSEFAEAIGGVVLAALARPCGRAP